MGDENGIVTEMGNRNGGVAKKRKKQRRREEEEEDVLDGNGVASDEDPNYQYVSIVDVNPPSPSSVSLYESATEEDDCQLIEVNKCSVIIGERPQENGVSRVCRVSVNGESGDIPNGVDIEQLGPPDASSSFSEKVSDSASPPGQTPFNGSASCAQILNGSSTNESLQEHETSKSDIGGSLSVIDQVATKSNGSSLVDIVSDSSVSSSTTHIPSHGCSASYECEVLKENGVSKSEDGLFSLVKDQVIPLCSSSPSIEKVPADSSPSFLELPCKKTSPTDQVSNGGLSNENSSDENDTSMRDTDGSPFVNGHSNGLSSTNGTSSPIFRTPDGVSNSDQLALPGLDSLEERLARAVRETLDGLPQGVELTAGLQEEVERVVREKLKRQRSGSSDCWNHDDTDDHCIVDFLDKINDHAEARLAAKRQARAEAREIRMRELERMQRESEDGDRVYDAYPSPVEAVNRCVRAGSVTTPRSLLSSNNSFHSSRRSSEDSLEEVNSIRDARHELRELEEKFRKAMIANAQLDNEKAAIAYQVDLFKDRYEELEEQNLQLSREHKETCRQLEQTKRHRSKLQEDLEVSRTQLGELLQLVQEKGLVVVEGDCSSSDEESEGSLPRTKKPPKKALVSADVADVLQQGSGSLDVRLKKFVEERNELLDELRRIKLELEEERAHSRGRHANGPTGDSEDIQREANKLLGDYKFKMQKAEQDVNTLQANVARLESQVVRYKSAAETSEKLEGDLKLEKRKLQRELREAQSRVEELETSHSHLQKRLDKLKNAKSALLKDL